MGQAKLRGTFEQRKAEAIKKQVSKLKDNYNGVRYLNNKVILRILPYIVLADAVNQMNRVFTIRGRNSR